MIPHDGDDHGEMAARDAARSNAARLRQLAHAETAVAADCRIAEAWSPWQGSDRAGAVG